MALRYQREGYIFRADAQTLSIKPGPKSITLSGSILRLRKKV